MWGAIRRFVGVISKSCQSGRSRRGAVGCVPPHILARYRHISELRYELGVYLYRRSLVRALVRESVAVLYRIQEQVRTRLWERLILLDPLYRTDATDDQRNHAQDACNEDMQTVFRRHSWMTQADARIFLLAWRLGAEWMCRSGNSSLSFVASGSPSAWVETHPASRQRPIRHLEARQRFTSQSVIPQDSKRDLSVPPPLRE